jgi:uncharacterized Tic20 family protein
MFNNLLSKLSGDEKSLFKTIKYTVSILVILIMLTYGLKFITKDSDIINVIGVFLLVISFFWSLMIVKQGLSVLIKDNESNDDSDKIN